MRHGSRGIRALSLALCGAAALLTVRSAAAQTASPNQPDAVRVRGLSPPPCRWLGSSATIQPLRIQPSQVPAKNAIGCLSAEDAVYGPDGCPIRFCGRSVPWLRLPAERPQSPSP